ncbi:MAG: NAD(P) transhydrogenase subunit alpha [Planctomycetota bacterium]|nr:NAD(P) transhydrogenase subunit alpha [Planctomycetota bacterium]
MLMAGLTIFIISIFVGVEVITKVPQKLHTPLMSGSNAISGITIVGAILVSAKCANQNNGLAVVLVGIAIALAMINVVGGFGVTHRMLSMFTKRKKAPST